MQRQIIALLVIGWTLTLAVLFTKHPLPFPLSYGAMMGYSDMSADKVGLVDEIKWWDGEIALLDTYANPDSPTVILRYTFSYSIDKPYVYCICL